MFEQLGWISSCHPRSPLPSLLPGSAPCPFLPGGLHEEPSLLDFCGWRAFSALRLLRGSVLCVPLSGSVGRACRHTGRIVSWGSMEASAGDPALTKHNDTESSDITANMGLHRGQLLSRHRTYRVSSRRQAREGGARAWSLWGAPSPKLQLDPPETPTSIPCTAEQPLTSPVSWTSLCVSAYFFQQCQHPLACPSQSVSWGPGVPWVATLQAPASEHAP